MQGPTNEHYDDSARATPLRTVLAPVVMIALLLALARIVYLAFLCPYTLIEDEAQYWVWSRHLAWSYYTKGPGVAWTILASTRVFGNAEWAVRLPAVLSSVVTLLAVAVLTYDTFRDRAIVHRAAWCAVLAPAYLAMSLLMTIDAPYLACWAVAAWCAWRAFGLGMPRYLLLLGAAVGVGVLYKYTMLLILPGIVYWAIMHRRDTKPKTTVAPWLVCGLLLMLAAFLPVILWNQAHHWPTIRHLLGHLGVEGGDMPVTQGKGGWKYDPRWTLELLATQFLLVGPVLALGIMGAIDAYRNRAADPKTWHAASFLVALAAPMYVFYTLVSFTAEPEGNWPIAGSVTLLPLAGRQVAIGWAAHQRLVASWRAIPKPRPWRGIIVPNPWNATAGLWTAAVVMGIVVGVLALRLDLLTHVPVLGRYIPIGRLTGARDMGRHAGQLVDKLRSDTGAEPFVITAHYGRASLLSYYMPGQPDVYCASSVVPGGRVTPWDFWPELRLDDPALRGRPAVVVGLSGDHWRQAFEKVSERVHLDGDFKLDKQGNPSRPAFCAQGFRGIPAGGLKDKPDAATVAHPADPPDQNANGGGV